MLFSLLSLLIVILSDGFTPANGDPLDNFCGSTGNYTTNSTYESNLKSLLSDTITSNASTLGFTNITVGQIPNQIYGFAMCRGDVNATTCRSCLQTANRDAQQLCPYDKSTTIFYDDCMLRYSNQYFLSSTDNTNEFYMWNVNNATDVDRFNELMSNLLNVTANHAAYNTTKKFATGEIGNYTKDNPAIYGLTQCTPDMTGIQCLKCLQDMIDGIPTNQLNGKIGGRMLGFRCNFRYEVYEFFEGTPMVKLSVKAATVPTPAPAPAPVLTSPSVIPAAGSSGKKRSTGVILAIAIPLATAVLLILVICICFLRRKHSTKLPYDSKPEDDMTNYESLLFDQSILKAATANFADENKLGEGGFGAVYKGSLPDGREIAVKKLLTSSNEGLEELKNELCLVAKLQHRNLVRLFGVSLQVEKLLVYEYVPNRSLDIFLFDPTKRQTLLWETRYKIIFGVARGLQYLHEESQVKIVHRDLKASNILLDADMNPKITDFGLAKLFGGDQTQGNTSRIVGTFGYMAPEYAMRGQFSNKSDTFSFGVLVLEIVTGRKNSGTFDSSNSVDLISYIWEKWGNGTILEVSDPFLGDHFPRSEMLRCIHIGLLCVQENPADRPNMSEVCVMLSSNTVSLQSPSKPAFVFGKSTYTSDEQSGKKNESSAKSIPVSQNDLSITDVEPR